MKTLPTTRLSLLILGILNLSLMGCGEDNMGDRSSTERQILIELQYRGGQISPELIPKLQILEGSTSRLVTGADTKNIDLFEAQYKDLLSKATDANFLALDSVSLQKKTRELMLEHGGPMPRVMDASTPTIRVWNESDYHEVSFYAPRLYLRHSGNNPDLARFVELLDELEKVAGQFPKD